MAKKRKRTSKYDESILLVSDLHAPYNHKDAIAFLAALKDEYKPTRVICIGDELDYHAMSFHTTDPNLPSASYELAYGRKVLQELEDLFPDMDLVSSNHGDMKYRKAKWAGIPSELIVPYNVACGVGDGWQWQQYIQFTLCTGQPCYVTHSYSTSTRKAAEHLGMCVIQGHYHTVFEMCYVQSPGRQYWGATVGSLIDDEAMAFAYQKSAPKRPILGTLVILDGQPYLKKMVLDEEGNWIGRVV